MGPNQACAALEALLAALALATARAPQYTAVRDVFAATWAALLLLQSAVDADTRKRRASLFPRHFLSTPAQLVARTSWRARDAPPDRAASDSRLIRLLSSSGASTAAGAWPWCPAAPSTTS